MRFIFIFIFLLPTFLVIGQKSITIPLNWQETPGVLNSFTQSFEFPDLEGAFVSESEFVFIKEFPRNKVTKVDFSLLNYQTGNSDKVTNEYLKKSSIEVKETPQFMVKNISKRGETKAMLYLVPFVKVNGEVRKIMSITFQQNTTTNLSTKSMNFASSSVLKEGSGTWYKIKVKSDGIYKIDYNFLNSIGINVDGINPQNINIYGNAFGRLPEDNDKYRPDDLLKNDIYVKGESDGVFNQDDYILFYGKGPNKWEYNESTGNFERILNNYATYSAYYINIDPNEAPARIQYAELSTAPSTHFVTDYNSYTIHEENTRNLMKSGQRWYGEVFDANLTQTFSMHIPNLVAGHPAHIRGAMASIEGSSTFEAKYNGISLGTASLGGVNSDSYSRGSFSSATGVFQPTSSTFQIQLTFNRTSPADVGYLDFLEVNARAHLKYSQELQFRDANSVGIGNIAKMEISNFPSNGLVWEITNPTTPKIVNGTVDGTSFSYKIAADSLRSFIAFGGSNFDSPEYIGKVSHQNLHGLPQVDYLMITHPLFLGQANRLADLHRANGTTVHVVTIDQVYNEFSGGTQDPTAIRMFAKMFYDRAEGVEDNMPKYLLLIGSGTYDPLERVHTGRNFIPVYETVDSESYTASLASDDYFGFLDDDEGFNTGDLLDIAVGRLIAKSEHDAKILVNKIEHYMKNGSLFYANSNVATDDNGFVSTHGDWRNKYTVIADDEEGSVFITQDLEPSADTVKVRHPEMNVKKIYSDAYLQISTAGGERYPEVNAEIKQSFESGTLVSCYVGHGGPAGAAAERIMTVGEIESLKNIEKLTLFVSATCEFARIDDIESYSIGERMALNEIGGAVALMTTSRAVFITTNSKITKKFFDNVFVRDAERKPRTFGEIIMDTKNGVAEGTNNRRSFILLGDPGLRIALPYEKVVLDSINGNHISSIDTIRALSHVRMSGHIEDQYGNNLNNFNGVIQPSIFDKPAMRKTLGQDATSIVVDFEVQESVLFKGLATVKDGNFSFEFIVPKDINYSYGEGKASFYSWSNANKNAGGYSNSFLIGGIDTTGLSDQEGPIIELYLNDEDFVNGGITNETPILYAKLYDESGINTVGNGIGHDITMILDNETSKAIVLNDFYESDLDTYKSGKLRYQMSRLSPGPHTLTFKAWDVNNNSSEKRLDFVVMEKKDLSLDHVLNYPNPFTTHTEFYFEHNQPFSALETQIEIFTVSGRLVRTINQLVETSGFRSKGIAWDGRDEFGDRLARGVYIYRLTVKNEDGEIAREMQKLYLLQ